MLSESEREALERCERECDATYGDGEAWPSDVRLLCAALRRISATRESAGGEASLDTLRLNWLDANPQLVLRSGKQHIRPLIDAAMYYDGIRNSLKEEDNGA